MSPKVLDDIDEIIVVLGLVLVELVVIFIQVVVDMWNKSLKSFWNRTFVKSVPTPLSQIPKNINENCGDER